MKAAADCRHPPSRHFAWVAYDGVLCVGCCACGKVLKGAYERPEEDVSSVEESTTEFCPGAEPDGSHPARSGVDVDFEGA